MLFPFVYVILQKPSGLNGLQNTLKYTREGLTFFAEYLSLFPFHGKEGSTNLKKSTKNNFISM